MATLRRSLAAAATVAAVLVPLAAGTPALAAEPAPSEASRLFALLNAERTSAGLPGLASRGDVVDIAAGWSARMADSGTISHNDAFFSSATKSSLGAKSVAENVGVSGDAEEVHRRLMASAPHRANILNPRLSVVGVGAARAGLDGMLYVTQAFVETTGATAATTAAAATTRATTAPARATTATTARPAAAATRSPAAARPTAAQAAPAAPPATAAAPAPPAPPAAQPIGGDGDGGRGGPQALVTLLTMAAGLALIGVLALCARPALQLLVPQPALPVARLPRG